MIERLARWLDERIGGSTFAQDKLTKVFPESWTFLFGEIALYVFVVLVLTGTYLALFFDPSLAETTYQGSYAPLVGEHVTVAYRSAVDLSFDVRAGLLIRQVHHWGALLFVAAIVVHLLRVFFTGAFRKPREINWVIGLTMLTLALVEGFAGYSLLDDLLSGTGLRIAHAIAESIPVAGTWLASLAFGGPFPGEHWMGRFFVAHVLLLPGLIGGLLAVHLALVVRQVHTQFPGGPRRQDNVVGLRVWPGYAAKSAGLFLLVFAVLLLLGGVAQINPVWLYGPYDPFLVTVGAQPDWYMGWLEGALRLFPAWEVSVGGFMLPNPFFPAVLLPGVTFGVLFAYPWIERRLTGDDREHQLLDRPRNRPVRTAVGVGALAFLAVLTIAGSDDVIAFQLGLPVTTLVWSLRIAALVLPLAVGLVTYRWCNDLAASSKAPPAAEDAEAAEPAPASPR